MRYVPPPRLLLAGGLVAVAALAAFIGAPHGEAGITPQVGVFTVDTAADHAYDGCVGGDCTLRDAITDANALAGTDTIRFSIGGGGVQTIDVGEGSAASGPLPDIADPVIMDGTSQPGYAGTPLIELDGTLATTGSGRGIAIFTAAAGSTIQGLAIFDFLDHGVTLVSKTRL